MTEEENKPRPLTLADWNHIQNAIATARDRREEALLAAAKGLSVDRSDWQVLYPLKYESALPDWGSRHTYLSVSAAELPFMVQAYINMIETERTNRLCKCEWIVHPDDVNKPEGTRRVHKGAESPYCPVHTKLGFLLYFFDHYFHSKCAICPPDCKDCTFDQDCTCQHVMKEKYQQLAYEPDGDEPESPTSRMTTVELPGDGSEVTQDVTAVAHDNQL